MSQIPRFFLPDTPSETSGPSGVLAAGTVLAIEGVIAHQIGKVLRLRPGNTIVVLDGRGSAWMAELRAVSRDRVTVVLGDAAPCPPEPRVQVDLFAAVLKGDRQDWLIQKAVELGVARIHPLLCDRSVVRPGSEKVVRWQRIAQEAAEQCERAVVPVVAAPIPLSHATWADATALVCTERQGKPLLAALPPAPALALLIGPEGGWAGDEVEFLLDRGALAVSLGPRILRAETAALAALAAIMAARHS